MNTSDCGGMCKINVGKGDGLARILAGLFIVSLAFWGPRSPWAWLGLIPLATGVLRFCPIYGACGISTSKPKEEAPK